MKLLLVSPQNPLSCESGAHQRSHLLLKSLLQFGTVDVSSMEDYGDPALAPEGVRFVGPGQQRRYRTSGVKRIIHNLKMVISLNPLLPERPYCLNRIVDPTAYDLVFVRQAGSVYLASITNFDNVVVDIDDLPEEYFLTLANQALGWKKYLWAAKAFLARQNTRILTRKVLAYFVATRVRTIPRKAYLLENIPVPNLSVALEPQGISKTGPVVLFVGLLSYVPNKSGLNKFIMECWETVIHKHPDAVLLVIGKGLDDATSQRWSSYRGVRLLGFVDDLSPLYRMSQVVISPIDSGSGTNIKVLEAMAYGKPCVLTEFSTRGQKHFLRDRQNCRVASSLESFAEAILELLADPIASKLIGRNAFNDIQDNYSFSTFSERVGILIKELEQ